MTSSAKITILATICGPIFAVVFIWFLSREDNQLENQVGLAQSLLADGKYEEAEQVTQKIIADEIADDLSWPLALSAVAAGRQGESDRALQYLQRYPADLDIVPDALNEILQLAQFYLDNGRLFAAEDTLRFLLARNERDWNAQRMLSRLLTLCGRRLEARKHFTRGIQSIPATLEQFLAMTDDGIGDREAFDILRNGELNCPDDPLVQLGLGSQQASRENYELAEKHYRKAIALSPNLPVVYAKLGICLLNAGKQAEIPDWNALLPKVADEHPTTWVVRGIWARDQDQNRAAIRCFWECLLRDPTNATAQTQLGRLLHAENTEAADVFLLQGEQSVRLSKLLKDVSRRSRAYIKSMEGLVAFDITLSKGDLPLTQEAAELFRLLGRDWEAHTLGTMNLDLAPDDSVSQQFIADLPDFIDYLNSVPTSKNAALRVDFSSYPLPDFNAATGHALTSSATNNSVSFRNIADRVGLNFTYFNSADESTQGMRMFEWTGGGVAILDFDRDGWPDVFLPQGCQWPASQDRRDYLDRLMRNQLGERFVDITIAAGLEGWRFSQGCTVGDFDSDGFPDLYVANIGQNSLYRNNGDGSFQEITIESGISNQEQWTTSCLLADVDDDGHPDIYDVNYITGEGVYTEMCQHNGVSRACTPTKFKAEQDRFYRNAGNGTFIDETNNSGIVVDDGVGLGIVAADFAQRQRIDLFVANDAFPNFFFVRNNNPSDPLFQNRAWLSGVAFNRDGRAQACMGVAVGDANGDCLVDMFVTNYFADYNTLYQQNTSGIFTDATMKAGLRQPSFFLLGFGTQFLDGELDGLPDLVLTNGDVDDFSIDPSRPYRQRPQYLRNIGDGKFRELFADEVGAFFAEEHLGRGLARVDWNRDGLADFVVSHLDSPAALLENASENVGASLKLRLSGVRSNRDAIGSIVLVSCGDEVWMQQLTAGDGYMASNERQLIFGLGQLQVCDRVEIRWPSGGTDVFEQVPTGEELVFVESTNDYYILP